jgi:hypothetical protein
MRAQSTIAAGICGFTTQVAAEADDNMQVTLQITTPCPRIRTLSENLGKDGPLDALNELTPGASRILGDATSQGICLGCVVPCGIFKTMQVAANLSLPANVQMTITGEG